MTALDASLMTSLPSAITTVYNNGDDLKARQNMALAAYYAGITFTQSGVGYVHAIFHTLPRQR